MSHAATIDGSREVRLDEVDPAEEGELAEAEATRRLEDLTAELLELQELIHAAERHGVLVVLQGMDAAGKDLTIQEALGATNPEAIRVKHFKPMTEDEARHDFLWRAHLETPARGEIVVFDRSYYEEIAKPLVTDEASEEEIEARCRDVRDFERILRNGGAIVVKVFLHVSPDEQQRRLVERMEDPTTAWKTSASDWTERRAWDRYMAAWDQTMNATATPEAPWHVVPADRRWFSNLAVAETLVERLRPHRETWLAERERIGREKRQEALEAAPEDVRRSA